VFTQPASGQEVEYNRWYTDQHLGDVLRVPGFVSAQRYHLTQGDGPAPAPYLAVYEFESDDVNRTLGALAERAGTPEMPVSPALDLTTVKTFVYEVISDRKTR
jgi:hypothetical protein